MKWIASLVAILLFIGALLFLSTSHKQKAPEEWPYYSLRQKVAKLEPKDIKTVVFDGLYRVRNLEDPKETKPFLDGLKMAVFPCDPKKGLPTDNVMTVKLITQKGETIGPYGFSLEGKNQALGKRFALAWNKAFPKYKIPIR